MNIGVRTVPPAPRPPPAVPQQQRPTRLAYWGAPRKARRDAGAKHRPAETDCRPRNYSWASSGTVPSHDQRPRVTTSLQCVWRTPEIRTDNRRQLFPSHYFRCLEHYCVELFIPAAVPVRMCSRCLLGVGNVSTRRKNCTSASSTSKTRQHCGRMSRRCINPMSTLTSRGAKWMRT